MIVYTSTRSPARRLAAVAGFGAFAVAAAVLYGRFEADAAPKAAAPARSAASAPGSAPAAASVQRVAAAARASAPVSKANGGKPFVPPLPKEDTPAELLRKVQMALGGNGTPAETLLAAMDLNLCATWSYISAKRAAAGIADTHGAKATIPPKQAKVLESMGAFNKELDERFQSDLRRCQVFDAATLARVGELYERAYQGGAENSATLYLNWITTEGLSKQTDPQLMARLRADVRSQLESGSFLALVGWPYMPDALVQEMGFSLVEARAYREASFLIAEQIAPGSAASTRDTAAKTEQLVPRTPLTDAQQHEADALAQRILDNYLKHRKP